MLLITPAANNKIASVQIARMYGAVGKVTIDTNFIALTVDKWTTKSRCSHLFSVNLSTSVAHVVGFIAFIINA